MFKSCGKEIFTGARGLELSVGEVKVKQKKNFDSTTHSPFPPTKMKDGAKSGPKRSRDDPGAISQTLELPSSLGTRCFAGAQGQVGRLTANPSTEGSSS